MTNLIAFAVLFTTNTVSVTNENMRADIESVAIHHVITYSVNGQSFSDTNYDVGALQGPERKFRQIVLWEELPSPRIPPLPQMPIAPAFIEATNAPPLLPSQ